MAERCHNCKERPSKGSIGMIRWCYECAAAITGHPKRYVRSEACVVEITNDGRHVGYAYWVPDFIAARFRKKAVAKDGASSLRESDSVGGGAETKKAIS